MAAQFLATPELAFCQNHTPVCSSSRDLLFADWSYVVLPLSLASACHGSGTPHFRTFQMVKLLTWILALTQTLCIWNWLIFVLFPAHVQVFATLSSTLLSLFVWRGWPTVPYKLWLNVPTSVWCLWIYGLEGIKVPQHLKVFSLFRMATRTSLLRVQSISRLPANWRFTPQSALNSTMQDIATLHDT